MAQRASNPCTAVATRVVFVPDVASRNPARLTPQQKAARRIADRAAYEAWMERQLQFAEREAQFRRAAQIAGLTIGLGLLALVGFAGWWVWHTITSANVRVSGGVVLLVLVLLVVGAKFGHRCVTTITHSH